jgi:2',3'-cyclic-nucleotide 2'-phosphodiesterase (5'-nucleotidase family)/predicted AlkP superfamily phosphohydrolase/phosphomutase
MFASDGMRPDLMEKYAKDGFMPTYKELMKKGVTGDNGMVQAFPPNTGVGWYTMATGTYPSEHGSTNNTFFRTGDTFSNRTSFSGAGVLQADTIANAAERAGKKVAQIDWVGGAAANINGPTVDFTNFFSNRGVLVGAADPVEQAGSNFFGVTYQVASVVPATGWASVPTGDPAATPKETTWTINSTFAAQNPNRTYNVYFYDSVTGGGVHYDHAIVSPVGKTGASPSIDLKVGDFLPIKLTGANGLIGARAGQTVGHYVKLISLAADASQFKLYDTSLARAIAKCGTVCNSLPAGGTGEDRLEKYIADNLLPWAAADFAPEEAGVVDEDTYVQQGRDLERAYSLQVINFILGTLQPDTNLAMVGYPFTDEVSHQFLGLVTPNDPDGSPNPCYDVTPKFDDVQCTGRGTAGRVAIREGYIRSAYEDADEKLGVTRKLMGGDPVTFAGSDHGFGAQRYAINANKVLFDATVNGVSLHASNANASNCGAATTDLAKACWAGGTIQIYVNPTLPAGITYEAVRTAAINAFQNLTDPANPGKQLIMKIMKKEELRNVDGSDSLHPNRSGDVVVVTNPPYQSDAGANGVAISLSHFFGQHGFLPNYVNLTGNINMHATFVLGGPLIKHKDDVKGLRAIDVAPTLSFLMDIPGPQNARGRILYDLVKGTEPYTEVTILDISDYHGQLIPLTDTADTVGPAFNIGGAAFLKTWFDTYEAESALSSKDNTPDVIEMAAGDSVGATPPISAFFEDRPTIEIMNLMGIDIDGLGNHNFDRGADFLRTELIPLANYPFVSANIVDANGNTPKEWSPSEEFKFEHGTKIGIVGFSNDDIPSLTRPGALDPFHVANSLTSVNAEAARIAKKVDAVVAIGHLGATGGTLTDPTGPLIDLADGVSNVDTVIGDHTDQQVLTTRNGVLVTENRSKGLRFTRVRLVIGPGKQGVVYHTADFHKPFDIGVTPNAAIQAKIDALQAQLAPIFNTVVGRSTVVIPRADACGQSAGRSCESLIGDLVTDAIRSAYSTDFALTNSGGLRADLTCPVGATDPSAGDFCPASLYPVPNAGRYPITRGQVLGVLPFGNVSATLTINGAELKDYLETAVSSLPATGNGRFGQVSGLCFTFNVEGAPATFGANGIVNPGTGSRVVGAVRQAADGSCTGAPVSFSSGVNYSLTTNDFTAGGGDGYPNNRARMTTQDTLDQDLADYLAAVPGGVISPVIQHRIHCTDPNPGSGVDCPVGSP